MQIVVAGAGIDAGVGVHVAFFPTQHALPIPDGYPSGVARASFQYVGVTCGVVVCVGVMLVVLSAGSAGAIVGSCVNVATSPW